MKKTLRTALTVLMLGFAVTLFAQRGQGQGVRQRITPQQRVENMKAHLGLSDEQAKELLEIYSKSEQDLSKENITPEERRAIMAKTREEAGKILTPEQRAKHEEHLQQAKDKSQQTGKEQGKQGKKAKAKKEKRNKAGKGRNKAVATPMEESAQ